MTQWNVAAILSVIGGGLAIGGLIKPVWPLVAVGLLLVAIAVFVIAIGRNV
jgi:hypothetical protein